MSSRMPRSMMLARSMSAMPTQSRSLFDRLLGRSRSLAVPLDEVFPSAPKPAPNSSKQDKAITSPAEVTTLANGVRVASSSSVLPASTVGVFVQAGSRYSPLPGLPHVLALLGLQSSPNRSELSAQRSMAELGGPFEAKANRDFIFFKADVLPSDASVALNLMSDSLLNGEFNHDEVSDRVGIYQHTVDNTVAEDAEGQVLDALHVAAFAGKGLGLGLHAPSASVPALNNPSLLRNFRDQLVRPDRIVVVGAGVDHKDIVTVAESTFGRMKPASTQLPFGVDAKSVYVGGESRCTAPTPDGFVHFGLGLSCGGWNSDDFVAACALSMLMGGGGSFSAGGPGKGMYSRLYMRVLSRHPWVHSAICTATLHSDSTLLSIHGIAAPEDAAKLVNVIAREAYEMGKGLQSAEVERAKNQLKSSLYMNLEQRHVLFEDLGQQVMLYGKRLSPVELAKKIDALRPEDIGRVAQIMLSKRPSVAIRGDVGFQVPSFAEIATELK